MRCTGVIYSCSIESGQVKLLNEYDGYEWLSADVASIDKLNKVVKEKMVRWD
ncbi:MAG TPA: hypothetical protein GXX49_02890 [Clostridiaceae bacterium]|jgi:hypothetical protein|nr:hypothetical protein [Clostridiaceae bacterium]